LEQAAVVARYVPAELDRSATQFATVATVSQLKRVLRAFAPADGKKRRGRSKHVSVIDLDDGISRISGELDGDQAALVRKALDAMRDDLYRQRKADAKAAAEASGEPEQPVDAPSSDEALTAMAETALQAGQAAHPSSERYLISYHLQAGPDGTLLLLDDRGMPVPDPERRRVLCDHRFEHVHHDHDATPLSVGRATRHVNRKLRRAVLHRHGFGCAVPGCDTTHGLEIHHIWHWEDGGPTDTSNLLPLCRHHHRAHHQGLIAIDGNADLPPGTPGAVTIGPPDHPLPPCGQPTPPGTTGHPNGTSHGHPGSTSRADDGEARTGGDGQSSETGDGREIDLLPLRPDLLDRLRDDLEHRTGHRPPDRATTPLGERLDRRTFHLQPDPPDPTPPTPPTSSAPPPTPPAPTDEAPPPDHPVRSERPTPTPDLPPRTEPPTQAPTPDLPARTEPPTQAPTPDLPARTEPPTQAPTPPPTDHHDDDRDVTPPGDQSAPAGAAPPQSPRRHRPARGPRSDDAPPDAHAPPAA
jgi:hypothetical protein